jgi:hypothetical protein
VEMISKLEYYKFTLQREKEITKSLIDVDDNVKPEDEDALEISWSRQTDLEMLALLEMTQDFRVPRMIKLQAVMFILEYIADPDQDLRDAIADFVGMYFEVEK